MLKSKTMRSTLAIALLVVGCSSTPVDVLWRSDAATLDGASPVDGADPPDDLAGADVPPGACERATDCPSGSYCDATACIGPGRCAPQPTMCAFTFDPVCGCDGRTYPNPCSAAMSGVRAVARGSCGIDWDAGPIDGAMISCGGTSCPVRQVCCNSTGRCYDPFCSFCCRP